MRLFAIAGVMVNVGENVARFFVGAFLKTGSNAVILRLSCLYYTDKLLLILGSEPGPGWCGRIVASRVHKETRAHHTVPLARAGIDRRLVE